MERHRDDDADAIRERMQNRNRRKRSRGAEGGTSRLGQSNTRRRSDESSGPVEPSDSADSLHGATARMGEMSTQGSTQPATMSMSQTSNPFPDFNRVMHPHVAAVNPFYAHQAMIYGQGAQLPGLNMGYLEAAGLSPFLLQEQLQARAFLAAQGLANYGNTVAGGLQMSDPSIASLRGGSVPQLAGSFATMDPSLLSPLSYPPELQRQIFSGSFPSHSQAGLAVDRPISSAAMPSSSFPASAAQHVLGGVQQSLPDPNQTAKTEDLYMPCDDDVLSDHQIVLRKQIEFFVAQQIDIDNFTPGRRKEISVGQVGIRCKHCAVLQPSERPRGAVYFPSTLRAIYQAAQNMASVHFADACEHIHPSLKVELIEQERKAVMGHGGKKYWAEGAMARGIYETERGLRFREGQLAT